MNEYDQDQKVQFCEWFQRSVLKDTEFVNKQFDMMKPHLISMAQ
jgi:hypothetical protein